MLHKALQLIDELLCLGKIDTFNELRLLIKYNIKDVVNKCFCVTLLSRESKRFWLQPCFANKRLEVLLATLFL